jgi:transposase
MRDRLDQWIIELAEAGKSQREIAKETGTSRDTVQRTLKKKNGVADKRQNRPPTPTPAPEPPHPDSRVTPEPPRWRHRK